MKMKIYNICNPLVFLTAVLCLTACRTPTRGLEPDTGDPIGSSKWTQAQDGSFVVDKNWWAALGDPVLNGLIDEAITNNLDLALMLDRVTRAEIELFGAKADQWPKLSASAGYTDVYSENFDSSGYTVGAGLSWEMDVWGRLKDKQEAEFLAYQATEADYRAGYLQVVGGMSRTYIFLRTLDEQRQLHTQTLGISRDLLNLLTIRQESGVSTSDELARQRAEIFRLESQLEEIDSRRKLLLSQLALLLGKEPGTVALEPAALQETLGLFDMPDEVQADLLTRRPDLVAAELRVKSAYQMQESTRAARWPQVSIGVSTALDPASAFSSQWIALISPQISFPVLDPQTLVDLKLSEVDLQSVQTQYKQAVLTAIDEVASSMVELSRYNRQRELEQKRYAEYLLMRKAVEIRVEAGTNSKIDLLGSKLNVIAVQQSQLDLYAEVLLSQVEVHNALGGGW
jgi:multidrug efflux system outer membrane protein